MHVEGFCIHVRLLVRTVVGVLVTPLEATTFAQRPLDDAVGARQHDHPRVGG